MKRFTLFWVLALAFVHGVHAEIVMTTVSGIDFLLDTRGKTAAVLGTSNSGRIIIPETVSYEGNSFVVNRIDDSAYFFDYEQKVHVSGTKGTNWNYGEIVKTHYFCNQIC